MTLHVTWCGLNPHNWGWTLYGARGVWRYTIDRRRRGLWSFGPFLIEIES